MKLNIRTKTKYAAFAVSIILNTIFVANGQVAFAQEKNAASYVKPFIGSAAHGHTYPGATVPFGMVQLSPDTGTSGWDWCSGYHDSSKSILGFSHTHLSGTGCGDLGDILFSPTVGPLHLSAAKNEDSAATNPNAENAPYSSPFSHENESAAAGYYKVKLDRDGGILVELTASERVGLHRYTFPKSEQANIVIDLSHGISDQPTALSLNIVGDHTVTGMRRSKGWANDQHVYFVAEFSQPFTSFGTISDKDPVKNQNRQATGKNLRGYLTFDTTAGKPIIARVALSTTSIEGAASNLAAEVKDFDFDKIKQSAEKKWDKALSDIVIESKDKDGLETFYTALYHTMLAPTMISDVDGQYRGSDHLLHAESRYDTYSTFSLWDTFRAEHPLFTILRPTFVNALITSILHQGQYQSEKTLAIWPLYGCETYCMIGYHSFPVIAEAYRKGIITWDTKAALNLMLLNSKRNDWWASKGYIPADKEDQSVSKTLEFAYDDWTLAQFAKAMGDEIAYQKFVARSANFKNLFDKKIGFVRGRLMDGSWRTPFNPDSSKPGPGHDFTEGTAWQYTFFAPHDTPGLISELGGREAFIKKLDQFFDRAPVAEKDAVQDVTGAIGQYAHGNEPSHHIAYLYSYAGAPEKTQQRVRQIRDGLYNNKNDGLCGNEDCGQMSAWYVFSALGFYPVNPASGEYVLGVPAFARASLKLENGKTFTVIGDPDKKFVASVLLNDKPLNRAFITHEDLLSGGTLTFVMSDQEGSKWAKEETASPH